MHDTNPVCAVTGANGYVGSHICRALAHAGWKVIRLERIAALPGSIQWSLTQSSDLAVALRARNVRALVHAAWDLSNPGAREYQRINIDGSIALLHEAQTAGVSEIVFISSISAFEGARSLYGRTKLAVEKEVARRQGLNLRPGLVWSENPSSIFGNIMKAVAKGGPVPIIGTGAYPQYLVHEEDLGLCVARACAEHWSRSVSGPITIAHPRMFLFRDLILRCAEIRGSKIRPVSVPWRAVYAALKAAEMCSLPVPFRSDSVLSLVNQNPCPDFSAIEQFNILLRPFGASLCPKEADCHKPL